MRISGSAEDTVVADFLTAARIYCENAQGRAFLTQTWDLYMDDWPNGPVIVPLPPLQSVSSITSYGTGGTAATVATSVYQVDAVSEPGRVDLAYGKSWPGDTMRTMNGFAIRFVAGAASAASVDETTKVMVKELAAHYFENREATGEVRTDEIPLGLQALIWQEKQVRL